MNKKEVGKGVWLYVIGAAVLLIAPFLLPKSGKYVLLDQLYVVMVVLIGGVYVIRYICTLEKSDSKGMKLLRGLVVLGCVIAMIWFSKDIALDIFHGTEQMQLYNVQMSREKAKYGVRYKLTGTDCTGNRKSFEVSADDYEIFPGEMK